MKKFSKEPIVVKDYVQTLCVVMNKEILVVLQHWWPKEETNKVVGRFGLMIWYVWK